jgi:hypothetical protein
MYTDGRKIRSVASNIYQLLWNIENSNQLPQQLKHICVPNSTSM